MQVTEQLHSIKQRIESACTKAERDPDNVKVIGVTKYVDVERAREAVKAGVRHLGENRMEGFLEKRKALKDEDVIWHFIGTLQSRKVKDVIPFIDYLHSLDRMSLANEIEKRAERPLNCFVQVNTSGEASKHGLTLDELQPFLQKLSHFEKINVVGLMTMAPHTEDRDFIRQVFRQLKNAQEHVKREFDGPQNCEELSMGMSNDFDIAVEEGATFIRVGSALVGRN